MEKKFLFGGALVLSWATVACGEHSVVRNPTPSAASPTVAPLISRVPQEAEQHSPTKQAADRAALQQKLAELDRLQSEIDSLRVATQSREQILVRVQMLEVDVEKLKQLGVELPSFGVGITRPKDDTSALLKALSPNGVATVLADPSLVVLSGEPASIHVGGEFPVPTGQLNSVEFRGYGTHVEVLAKTLGNNKVRLQVCPRVSRLDMSHAIEVNGIKVPAVTVRQCDFSGELEFGESAVVSGLVERKPEQESGGQKVGAREVAVVLIVSAEAVGDSESQSPPRLSQSENASVPTTKQ